MLYYFPHKLPSIATTNRVLFTNAEDELFSMGMITYNNVWNEDISLDNIRKYLHSWEF